MKQIFYFIIILIVVTAPGQFVGEHVYCFTSENFDVRKFLNNPGQENELVIGVGTMNNLPDTVIWEMDITIESDGRIQDNLQ